MHQIISAGQFGFRKQTGCPNAKTILKETIFSYNSEGSNVRCAFIDMSKAIERLHYGILLTKIGSTSFSIGIKNYCEHAEKLLC